MSCLTWTFSDAALRFLRLHVSAYSSDKGAILYKVMVTSAYHFFNAEIKPGDRIHNASLYMSLFWF